MDLFFPLLRLQSANALRVFCTLADGTILESVICSLFLTILSGLSTFGADN